MVELLGQLGINLVEDVVLLIIKFLIVFVLSTIKFHIPNYLLQLFEWYIYSTNHAM